VRFAVARGIRCIVNPAPAQPVDLAALAGVDYFVPNETEAETITGMPVRTVDDATACARHLVAQGLRRVIVTLGEKGALLAHQGGVDLVAPYQVATKDTTGAGDAFVGSFAVFLGEGLAEKDAIARANLYAALSTTGVGTQKSFVTRQQFDAEWDARQRTREYTS
jgi:ribokinase